MFAALFPGQGSQHVGMGKSLYDEFQIVRSLFEEASDTVRIDFKKLCFDGSEEALALTENTQPALLLVSHAIFRVLKETLGFTPSFVAGHSLGEYSALVSVETLKFSDGISAVRSRGQFMQEAVPVGKGAMAAVMGLEDDEVRKLCQWVEGHLGKPVEPANFNSPGQVVISGAKVIIDRMATEVDGEKVFGVKKRLKLIPLKVSAPFHCSMMKPAEERMTLVLNPLSFKKPLHPVVQNFSASEQVAPSEIKTQLLKQICSPVLWTQSVRRLKTLGVSRIYECGPGRVLSGLVKKIDSEISTFNIQSIEDIKILEKEGIR